MQRTTWLNENYSIYISNSFTISSSSLFALMPNLNVVSDFKLQNIYNLKKNFIKEIFTVRILLDKYKEKRNNIKTR